MALLTSSDIPPGLATASVLANLGGDPAIDKASRQAHDESFIVIGGKYAKSDAAVASSAYKAILIDATLVVLYLNNEVLRRQNEGLIAFLSEKVDRLLKASLKDGGAIEGLTLITADQAEVLSGGTFFQSNTKIFGESSW